MLMENDLDQVSGGANWGQTSAGIELVAIGVAMAATPIGWVGMAAAGAASFGGGYIFGSSFNDDLAGLYPW